ncbi:30S ribosomal protein S3 [Candidatus Zinderia endosymbiont of Aphrophora alni]|uniref:30S ribosomal protein S3 n=1 Tax=Candidatus Zinderia endosymbiont of Aphrophora alni TaxID=3077951 RepID=UPI0030D2EFE1
MGQKINPVCLRLALNKKWRSSWFADKKFFSLFLIEDLKIRFYIKKIFHNASINNIFIERNSKKIIKIIIYTSRPGILIGKGGEGIELLKKKINRLSNSQIYIIIEEVLNPELEPQLISQIISQQLEKRVMFRRAMKRAIQNAVRLGVYGIKIMLSGRLNGIEIARKEWYCEGRLPLHTLSANIDYGFSEAKTSFGIIGVKVWVCKTNIKIKN